MYGLALSEMKQRLKSPFFLLTLDSGTIIEPSQKHDIPVFAFCEIRKFLFVFGQPFVVPLDRNDTALGTAKTCPHAAALDQIFCSGVGGVERTVFKLTPVGYKAPFHSVKDELLVTATHHRRLRAGSNIIARYKLVLILPVVYIETVSWKASYGVVLKRAVSQGTEQNRIKHILRRVPEQSVHT